MADLAARPALAACDLPFSAGAASLAALPEAAMLEILPFRGRAAAVAAVLGVGLPAPGRVARLDGATLAWAGLDRWLVRGPAAGAALAARLDGLAAALDQTDGWIGLALGGGAAREVLARLAPVDLAPEAFPSNAAARTALRHVPCLILAAGDGFELLAPRSCATAVVADLVGAMRSVAALAEIADPRT